jgi:Flp pilus assembly protein TadD
MGASIALGRLFSEMGDVGKAEAAFRHASWLDVHDAEALNLMALLSVRQNRLDDAFQTQRRAVSRQPDQPRQYLLLSDILVKMGRTDEAHAALAQVTRLKAAVRTDSIVN